MRQRVMTQRDELQALRLHYRQLLEQLSVARSVELGLLRPSARRQQLEQQCEVLRERLAAAQASASNSNHVASADTTPPL